MEVRENQIYHFFDEEYEAETHLEGSYDLDAPLDDGEIENYSRQFADFMQAQLHMKYDLISYRKISRM